MTNDRLFERRRVLRGAAYSLEEFQHKYELTPDTACDLYTRFGPSSVELDLLMAAKRRKPSLTTLIATSNARRGGGEAC